VLGRLLRPRSTVDVATLAGVAMAWTWIAAHAPVVALLAGVAIIGVLALRSPFGPPTWETLELDAAELAPEPPGAVEVPTSPSSHQGLALSCGCASLVPSLLIAFALAELVSHLAHTRDLFDDGRPLACAAAALLVPLAVFLYRWFGIADRSTLRAWPDRLDVLVGHHVHREPHDRLHSIAYAQREPHLVQLDIRGNQRLSVRLRADPDRVDRALEDAWTAIARSMSTAIDRGECVVLRGSTLWLTSTGAAVIALGLVSYGLARHLPLSVLLLAPLWFALLSRLWTYRGSGIVADDEGLRPRRFGSGVTPWDRIETIRVLRHEVRPVPAPPILVLDARAPNALALAHLLRLRAPRADIPDPSGRPRATGPPG